jgi:DNA invertase Pin-like site-specific DNA recombinase
MRVSKADGSQVFDLQRDALIAAGVPDRNLYSDTASGKLDDRPGLEACLKALRDGDTLVVWKLDRLGRNLRHLVNVVHDLTSRNVGFRVLTGQGASIDTTTPSGKLVFGIFASLAEFERDLISERTRVGLASARLDHRHLKPCQRERYILKPHSRQNGQFQRKSLRLATRGPFRRRFQPY